MTTVINANDTWDLQNSRSVIPLKKGLTLKRKEQRAATNKKGVFRKQDSKEEINVEREMLCSC